MGGKQKHRLRVDSSGLSAGKNGRASALKVMVKMQCYLMKRNREAKHLSVMNVIN